MKLIPPIAVRHADPTAERIRANHEQRISELQAVVQSLAPSTMVSGLTGAGYRFISNILLKDGVPTPVLHGVGFRPNPADPPTVGKTPVWCRTSDVRAVDPIFVPITSTGRIVMLSRDAQFVTYLSTGWGTDIVVDLEVG